MNPSDEKLSKLISGVLRPCNSPSGCEEYINCEYWPDNQNIKFYCPKHAMDRFTDKTVCLGSTVVGDTTFASSIITTEDTSFKTTAKRYNQGKPDLSLLPRVACEQEALVWGFGSQKYGRDNWQKLWGKDTVNICLASLLRHAMAMQSGELIDSETNLPHAAAVRCNAAMILQHMSNEGLLDYQKIGGTK